MAVYILFVDLPWRLAGKAQGITTELGRMEYIG